MRFLHVTREITVQNVQLACWGRRLMRFHQVHLLAVCASLLEIVKVTSVLGNATLGRWHRLQEPDLGKLARERQHSAAGKAVRQDFHYVNCLSMTWTRSFWSSSSLSSSSYFSRSRPMQLTYQHVLLLVEWKGYTEKTQKRTWAVRFSRNRTRCSSASPFDFPNPGDFALTQVLPTHLKTPWGTDDSAKCALSSAISWLQ